MLEKILGENVKAIVTDGTTMHRFKLGEQIEYVGSTKRPYGEYFHEFKNAEGKADQLVAGEFAIKKEYGIEIEGCDATTYFNMEMTPEQFEFLKKLSELSKKHSRYDCMPTLEVSEELVEADEEDED